MAKTDPEADVSEYTSENEDADQVQSEPGSSKMTLEQRQQKLAQLRARMVRQEATSVPLHYSQTDSSVPLPKRIEHLW